MTRASGASAHEAAYDPVDPPVAPDRFECRVTCSCGDFDRVSTSKVGATRARANARSTFTRHVRDAVRREAVHPEPAPPVEPAQAPHPEPTPEPTPDPGPEPEPTPDPDPTPEPEPTLEPEPTPEPPLDARDEPPRTELALPPVVAVRARRVLVPVLVVLVVLTAVVVMLRGRDDAREPGTAGATSAGVPTSATPSIATPTSAGAFVAGLRTLDPVFDGWSDDALTRAGEAVCAYYATGQDVVQIIASTGNAGDLTPQQSATVVRLASPVFCPNLSEPMTEELDGLG